MVDKLVSKPDPLTQEAIKWLRLKQPGFTAALSDFGVKMGNGYEEERDTLKGQFTGEGLCGLAVAAQELAIKNKFGTSISTLPYQILASYRDLDTYKNKNRVAISHWILIFWNAAFNGDIYFADPTFRQFLISVKPDKMLVGISVKRIGQIYDYPLKISDPEQEPWVHEPRLLESKLFFYRNCDLIKNGAIEGIVEEDYMKLPEAFL